MPNEIVSYQRNRRGRNINWIPYARWAAKEGAKYAYNWYNQPSAPKARTSNYSMPAGSGGRGGGRRPRRRVKGMAKVAKSVKQLQKQMNRQTATHTNRKRITSEIATTVNESITVSRGTGASLTELEAAMANLRYFDPGTNALVTADPSSGTYDRELTVQKNYHLLLRNNYQVPCEVRVYGMIPKHPTSVAPSTAWTNGLTDSGNPSAVSTLVYPSDSRELRETYTTVKSVKKILQPGQQIELSHFVPKFDYEFSYADEHTLNYHKQYGAHIWLIRVQGVLGHDSSAAEYGTMIGGVDCQETVTHKFFYDAGKDLEDYSVSDQSNGFTNGGLVSNKPASGQQAYSI